MNKTSKYANIVQSSINDKLIKLALDYDVSLSDITDRYYKKLNFMTKYNSYLKSESQAMTIAYRSVKNYVEHNYNYNHTEEF